MKGVSSLNARLLRVPPRAEAALRAALAAAARDTAAAARGRAPVRTGRLRASIQASSQGLSAAVSVHVPYAQAAEKRSPFLLPSAQESNFGEKVKNNLREVF